MKPKVDKTWSIEHEGPLNKNNLIFRDKKIIRLIERLKKAGPQTVTK